MEELTAAGSEAGLSTSYSAMEIRHVGAECFFLTTNSALH
jgi:hypothetical protein